MLRGKRLQECIKDKKVIRSSQQGFNEVKSFLINFIASCDELTITVSSGKAVNVVYLNFSKTFNTISRTFLLPNYQDMAG